MDITFTLQAGFSGTQADNFNISGVTSSGTLMSLGSATKAQLLTGHTVNANPTITGGTITSTGVCDTSVNWLTFGVAPTPTPTPSAYFEFTGSGYGVDESSACNDATNNNRYLYSDCETIQTLCYVYTTDSGNPLVGFNNVYIGGAVWDISSVTGRITGISSVQC